LKKILFTILQYTIFLGLGIVLLYLALRSIDFQILWNRILTARYEFVLLSLLFGFISFYVRAYRWNIMIEPLGFSPKLGNTYHAVIIGYMANYAFPRIGEVTRCGVLSRSEKIPADALIGTVIAERAFDLLILFMLTIAIILVKLKFFGRFFSEKIFHPIVHKLTNLIGNSYIMVLIALGILGLGLFLVYVFRENILKITFVRKVGKIGKGVMAGLKTVFKIKRIGPFLVHTFLLWFLYLIMAWCVLYSLEPTSKLTLLDALFVLIAGSYGMAAPVQAGIGAYHGIIALALSIYAVSWNDAMAYAILSHGSQAIGIILLGLVSLIILLIKRQKNKIAV
jgi:uncharacterized protein (TIRG00374 family)